MTTHQREYIYGLITQRRLEVDFHTSARFAATWAVLSKHTLSLIHI